MAKNSIDIGCLEEKSSWLLHSRFFPSKIGGKPAWLDLKNLPSPSDLTCKICSDPLLFLCQIYAPYEESNECFHRTIFIFICRRGECCKINSADNFVVFRCQLPRKNDYYAFEPYEENESEVFSTDQWPKLCNVCGSKAPSHCSKCKKTFYCSRKHQILDWQKGHKELCPQIQADSAAHLNNLTVTDSGKSLLFKEWEIVIDEEDDEEVADVDANQEMEKLNKMIQERRAGTMSDVSDSELEQYAQKAPEDKVYNKFSKRIARHPEQVLRYDRGGSPLWITGNAGNGVNIPNCQYCNGERQFEFQVMPQLLNFIDVGVDFQSIDWGILAIYTCKTSCNEGLPYKQEFMIKQDLN